MIATILRTCLSIALGLSSLIYAPSVSALSEYIAAPSSTDATAINGTNRATFAPPLAQSKLTTTPTLDGTISVNEYGSWAACPKTRHSNAIFYKSTSKSGVYTFI